LCIEQNLDPKLTGLKARLELDDKDVCKAVGQERDYRVSSI
jgi:hypothetical protein